MRRGRSKVLSELEKALWRQVALTVTPLAGRAAVEPEPQPDPVVVPAPAPPPPAPGRSARPEPAPVKPSPPPLVPLERRLRTQLRRGRQGVEASIDLHGMRQDEAHAALRSFLFREQGRGSKLVLVVTGKGAAGDALYGEERGVLRRSVPHWLRLPDLRPLVLGFEEAEQRHGGGGALYIRLRRVRGERE